MTARNQKQAATATDATVSEESSPEVAPIVVNESFDYAACKPLWSILSVPERKSPDGTYHVTHNGVTVARLTTAGVTRTVKSANRDGKVTERKCYRDADDDTMPHLLWRHALVYVAERIKREQGNATA